MNEVFYTDFEILMRQEGAVDLEWVVVQSILIETSEIRQKLRLGFRLRGGQIEFELA